MDLQDREGRHGRGQARVEVQAGLPAPTGGRALGVLDLRRHARRLGVVGLPGLQDRARLRQLPHLRGVHRQPEGVAAHTHGGTWTRQAIGERPRRTRG